MIQPAQIRPEELERWEATFREYGEAIKNIDSRPVGRRFSDAIYIDIAEDLVEELYERQAADGPLEFGVQAVRSVIRVRGVFPTFNGEWVRSTPFTGSIHRHFEYGRPIIMDHEADGPIMLPQVNISGIFALKAWLPPQDSRTVFATDHRDGSNCGSGYAVLTQDLAVAVANGAEFVIQNQPAPTAESAS